MSFPNSPGVYTNIVDRAFTVSGSGVVAGAIVLTASRGPTEVRVVTGVRELIDLYGTPSKNHPALYAAERFLRRAGILSVLRVVNDAEAASGVLEVDDDVYLTVDAANPGIWGNSVKVTFSKLPHEVDGVFQLNVFENDTLVETFKVSRDVYAKDGYGNNIFIENVVNMQSNYIRVTDHPEVTGEYDYDVEVVLSGGSNDTSVPGSTTIAEGWAQFSNKNEYPANILINGGFATVDVHQAMLLVAETRQDSRAILDIPEQSNKSVEDMIDYKESLGSVSYLGGIYGGWLKISDRYNAVPMIEIPPSGDVAANFVETFSSGEYWDAPAGFPNGVIPDCLGTTKIFSEGELDLLYTNGINPISTFAGANAVMIGQKTLQLVESPMNRFNVVNSVIWMRNRIADALVPFVHKNNNEFTRSNIEFLLTSFLSNIKQRGGLYGFEVDVSSTLNNAQVIANNQLIVNVFLQPVMAAEFVQVNLIITPNGVELAG